MSTKTELSKQQKKSQETKEKIFQAAKILQKSGYENCQSRISVKKQACRTEVSIITLRQKMICCLII